MRDPAVPRHVAIIMDGNGRWAAKRRLGRVRGHLSGISAVRNVVRAARDQGVRYLTLFAFSSENWGRPGAEVSALMGMLTRNILKEVPDLKKQGVRLRAIGDISRLPALAVEAVQKAQDATLECDELDLILALSYGGRGEILHAVRAMMEKGVDPASVDEETFRQHLYLPDVPDPDLLIRTSGENRISNFLLWQLAYAEIYITDVLWPDFGEENFLAALAEYAGRERRFGKTTAQLTKEGR